MRFSPSISVVATALLFLAGCGTTAEDKAQRHQDAVASATVVEASPTLQTTASPDPVPSRVDSHVPHQPQVAVVSKDPSGSYITQTAYAATPSASPSSLPPSPTEAKKTPPADAFAGADKDAPQDAIVLMKNAAGAYAITTPSGNINCQFGVEFEGCGLVSFQQEGRYRDGDTVNWFVRFNGEHEPSVVNLTGTPAFMSGAVTLDYKVSAKAGDYVCQYDEPGMTCWNTKTKRGFFVNRDGYTTFNTSP